jgi:hypothetical protein
MTQINVFGNSFLLWNRLTSVHVFLAWKDTLKITKPNERNCVAVIAMQSNAWLRRRFRTGRVWPGLAPTSSFATINPPGDVFATTSCGCNLPPPFGSALKSRIPENSLSKTLIFVPRHIDVPCYDDRSGVCRDRPVAMQSPLFVALDRRLGKTGRGKVLRGV